MSTNSDIYNILIPVPELYQAWILDGRKEDFKIFLQDKGWKSKGDCLYIVGKTPLSNELLSQHALLKAEQQYKLDKHIAIPPPNTRGTARDTRRGERNYKRFEHLLSMDVGDSTLLPDDSERASFVNFFKKHHRESKLKSATVSGGIRVWRIK